VESLVKYSKLEFVVVDSELEFVFKLKFLITLAKNCLLVEFQLFDSSIPESIELKFPFGSVDLYIGFPMLTTDFFID
jgi:hypothetical protein